MHNGTMIEQLMESVERALAGNPSGSGSRNRNEQTASLHVMTPLSGPLSDSFAGPWFNPCLTEHSIEVA